MVTFLLEFLPFETLDIWPSITRRMFKRLNKNALLSQTNEFTDDDVLAEEKRVKEKKKDDLQIRVSLFNKIYTQMFTLTNAVK